MNHATPADEWSGQLLAAGDPDRYRLRRTADEFHRRSKRGSLYYVFSYSLLDAVARYDRISLWLLVGPVAVFLGCFWLRLRHRPPGPAARAGDYHRWARHHWLIIHAGLLFWGLIVAAVGWRQAGPDSAILVATICTLVHATALSHAYAMYPAPARLGVIALLGPGAIAFFLPGLHLWPVGVIFSIYFIYLMGTLGQSAKDFDWHLTMEIDLLEQRSGLESRVASEVAQSRAKDQALIRQARIAAMGEMVAAIAHQWRQPLAVLSMIVQDLHAGARQGQAPSAAEWDAFKADAMAQIHHMSETIEEFRNFQRPDARSERFFPQQCLQEALSLSSAQFREHRISQELHVNCDPALHCLGVPSQLTQVLLTLLVNAKEAIEDARRQRSGAPEQGKVVLTLAPRGERLSITVVDNGGGIPEDLRERIFEPYVTTKEAQGGSGLGLYLARMIMDTGFAGTISHCAGPEGTCFTLDLPVAE